LRHNDYGGSLLPGEGSALAQFVQHNMRIPRRGEIGWMGKEIESLEDEGNDIFIYLILFYFLYFKITLFLFIIINIIRICYEWFKTC
jgi:hypothetical protein